MNSLHTSEALRSSNRHVSYCTGQQLRQVEAIGSTVTLRRSIVCSIVHRRHGPDFLIKLGSGYLLHYSLANQITSGYFRLSPYFARI
jgi:hypothetical protein